jgi:hypothetical protein
MQPLELVDAVKVVAALGIHALGREQTELVIVAKHAW